MTKSLSILGSTGSIGKSAVAIAHRLGIAVEAIAANENSSLLEEQARLLKPRIAALYSEKAAASLREALSDTGIEVLGGEEGLIRAACSENSDTVLTAVSGSVGLKPTLAAIRLGRRIALANKETLVCAGDLVMREAGEYGAEIIPVDSEHSAIFQCLAGNSARPRKILLTASGGPFRGMSREQTENVTAREALRHPNWSMGAKITIDSATMMNKGLEFIEAMHLFSLSADEIEVLIHPESVVHSMVEYADGSVIAQMGIPDMTVPIQYALTWPERLDTATEALNLARLRNLTFERPDFDAFPCLRLAVECARRGGTAPAVMSAANEQAVALFLGGKISFGKIYACAASALDNISIGSADNLYSVLEADASARRYVLKAYHTFS